MEIGKLLALFFDTPGAGGVVIVVVFLSAFLVYWRLTSLDPGRRSGQALKWRI